MRDMIQVRFLMALLTLVDLIFLAVFLLVVSSAPADDTLKMLTINNVIEGNSDGMAVNSSEQVDRDEMTGSESQLIVKDDYEGTMDDSYVEFLSDLLIGDYYVSDTMWFDFEPDGVYNGFFDSNSPNISDGFYEVVMIEEVPTLHIYNEGRTGMVSYILILDQQNVVLRYEAANINLKLKN